MPPATTGLKVKDKNVWQPFTYKFDAIEATDHHVTLVVHLRNSFNTFVAIRNFGIVAHLMDEEKTMEYPINCRNQTLCEKSFNYDYSSPDAARFKWVEDGGPTTGGSAPDDYWVPTNKQPIGFKFIDFREDTVTDALIKFRYWISSDEPSLVISAEEKSNNPFATLSKTQDVAASDKITWYHGEIHLSDVNPPFNMADTAAVDEMTIYFSPSNFAGHVLAIDFEEPEIQTTEGEKSRSFFDFILSKKSGRSDTWLGASLPTERMEVRLPEPEHELTVGDAVVVTLLENESPSAVYSLHSMWMTASSAELPFECRVAVEAAADEQVSIIVNAVDYSENGQIVDTSAKSIANIKLSGKESKKIEAKVLSPASPSVTLRRIEVLVSPVKRSQSQILITIDDLVFGDRCHFHDPCVSKSEENTCIPAAGFQYKCLCDKAWTGDTCERENFCETETINQLTGYEYCKQIGGGKGDFCLSHTEKSTNALIPSFDCICEDADYWEPKTKKCVKFSECSLVTHCPGNTACDPDNYTDANPCSGCRIGYERIGDDCVEINPCPGDCGDKSLCYALREADSRPTAVCFCPTGFELVKNEDGSVHCSAKPLRKDCPEIFRRSAGCQHTCSVDRSNVTIGTNVICKCMDGYELNEDGKTCREGETLSQLDSKCDELEVRVLEKNKAICVCKAGYDYDKDKVCRSIKYCDKEENSDDIESFCGKNVKTCEEKDEKIRCNCRTGMEHKDYGFGKAFGCLHLSTEESCIRFRQENEGKEKAGQVCRNIVVPKSEKFPYERLGMNFSCLPSQQLDDEEQRCRPRCEIRENILTCLRDDKVCKNDPSHEKIKCECAAGFMELGGKCHAATSVARIDGLKIKLPLDVVSSSTDAVPSAASISNEKIQGICKNDPDTNGCLSKAVEVQGFVSNDAEVKKFVQISSLQQKIVNCFKGIFSGIIDGYTGVDILTDPVIQDDSLFTEVSLIFVMNKASSRVGTPNSLAGNLLSKCLAKKAKDPNYCVLPGGLAFNIEALESANESAATLDPCNTRGMDYCSRGTECKLAKGDEDWSFPHNCVCGSGYHLEQVSYFNVTDSSKKNEIRHEFCRDIDECLENTHKCDKNSTCFNTEGSHVCNCNDGFKAISNEEPKKCIEVCHEVVCQNGGTCGKHATEGNAFACSCADGFRGMNCEFEDEKAKSLRTTLIVVAVILSLLLLAAIVAAIVIHKR